MKKVISSIIFVVITAFSIFSQDFGSSQFGDSINKVKTTRSGISWSTESAKLSPENVILTTEAFDFRVTYSFVNDKLLKEQHDFMPNEGATALHVLTRFVKTTEYLIERYGRTTYTHISDNTAIWYFYDENASITLMYTDERSSVLPNFSINIEYSKK